MCRRLLYFTVFLTVFIFAYGVRGGENLVLNPDFEYGLAYWKADFPAPNETKYADNQKFVSVVDNPDGEGRVVLLDIAPEVASSQGVKAVTRLMRIEKGASYQFGAEVYTTGSSVKIFLEGYREDPAQNEAGHDKYPGLRRVFRKTIHVRQKANEWGGMVSGCRRATGPISAHDCACQTLWVPSGRQGLFSACGAGEGEGKRIRWCMVLRG